MAKKKVMTKREAHAVWVDPQFYGIAAACSTGFVYTLVVSLFKRRTVIWNT
jgi:hypothetical protein